MKNEFYEILDKLIPNPVCELNYNTDYELLIATILSAQTTDARVNIVTKELFSKYTLNQLKNANQKDIEKIIRSLGAYTKKASYIIEVARSLIEDQNGVVPNDREYLESLPGVGRKTANVVLKNIYNVPVFPVDTHVMRVSKKLGLADEDDTPEEIEQKLIKLIPEDKINKVGDQLLLFGRYYCTSRNPNCKECELLKSCKKPVI